MQNHHDSKLCRKAAKKVVIVHFQMELIEPIDSKRRPRELDVQHQIGRVRALLQGFTAEKSELLCSRPLHRLFLRIDLRSSSDDLFPIFDCCRLNVGPC